MERTKIIGDTGHFVLKDDDLFTSDPHYHHANVIKFCNRPFCCKHSMNEGLIQRFNGVVTTPDRRVFILGDFAFGSPNAIRRILARLNGYKILIKGNHDRGRTKMAEYGFDEVWLTAEATWGDKTVFMQHVPDRKNHGKFDIHLCGHVHEKWCKTHNIINVGVDIWDLEPKTLKFLAENADKVQSGMAEQNTLESAWEDRNDTIIADMQSRMRK